MDWCQFLNHLNLNSTKVLRMDFLVAVQLAVLHSMELLLLVLVAAAAAAALVAFRFAEPVDVLSVWNLAWIVLLAVVVAAHFAMLTPNDVHSFDDETVSIRLELLVDVAGAN